MALRLSGNMDVEDTLIQSIYYGKIGSETTERLLARFGHDGSFLLRDSETLQGALCLCVRLVTCSWCTPPRAGMTCGTNCNAIRKKAPYVHTYRLTSSADGWYMENSRQSQPRFRTLRLLIEHYTRTRSNNNNGVQLVDPLHKAQVDEGFIYMEMNTSSFST